MSGVADAVLGVLAGAGLPPAPHQVELVTRTHRLDPAGRWQTPEVGVVISRQNGKTETVAAKLAVSALLLGQTCVYVAHGAPSYLATFRRLRDLAERVPILARHLRTVRTANGQESILGTSGGSVRFLSATGKPPRGWTDVAVLIYDELMFHGYTFDLLAALNPTQAAHPNPQTWSTSSAGDSRSTVLNALRDRGHAAIDAGDPGPLAWVEWSAAAGCALDDDTETARANPALGRWLSPEYLRRQAATLPEPQYRTEHLGQWVPLLDRWLPAGVLERCADPTATVPDGAAVSFALDAAPDLTGGVISAAYLRPDGRLHVETVLRADAADGPVTVQLEARARALAASWRRAAFGYDPRGPLAALGDRLTAARLRMTPVPPADRHTAAQLFAQLAGTAQLVHPADPVLLAAADLAVPYRVGDTLGFRRRDAAGDISALYGAVMAAWLARAPAGRAVIRS